MSKLPENFLWGSAVAAHQLEVVGKKVAKV